MTSLICTFRYFGLQTIIENFIRSQEIKVFTRTMRQLVCMMDEWDGLTMDDIRRMEEEAAAKLDEMIKSAEKKDAMIQVANEAKSEEPNN